RPHPVPLGRPDRRRQGPPLSRRDPRRDEGARVMRRVMRRGLLTRKLRWVLTSLAILLGVAMIAGTFILTDQINNAFGDIFHTATARTDAVLPRKAASSTQQLGSNAPLPESLVAKVRQVPGVAKAQGEIGGT